MCEIWRSRCCISVDHRNEGLEQVFERPVLTYVIYPTLAQKSKWIMNHKYIFMQEEAQKANSSEFFPDVVTYTTLLKVLMWKIDLITH